MKSVTNDSFGFLKSHQILPHTYKFMLGAPGTSISLYRTKRNWKIRKLDFPSLPLPSCSTLTHDACVHAQLERIREKGKGDHVEGVTHLVCCWRWDSWRNDFSQ